MPSWLKSNGSNDQEASKQQRKRWEIEDKKLLKNLRYQLAEDGNSECQFLLAKQLLDDADGADESSVKGVAYLKKAAEQGHDMAMQLLETCFRMRKGIVSTNESEIRKFLEMTPAERAVKRAAQELFNSLSNGNAFVTVEQLQTRMREIYKMQQKKRKPHQNRGEISLKQENGEEDYALDDLESSSSSSHSPLRVHSARQNIDSDNRHISEANLLSAAQSYTVGRIPAINQTLTLSVPHPQTLEHVPYFHRAFFHPAMFISLLYHRLVDIFSSITIESMKKYQIFILLAAYAVFSTKNLPESLPAFAYYLSLAVMIVASFKMLKSKHQFIDFRIWSGLFLSYNENVYADDSENLFLKKNMIPYLWFFVAFAVNLMIHPFLIDQGLPYSEITVIGIVLAFMTMVTFMRTSGKLIDLTILSSFALNVLAKYPYEMDSVVSNKWRFLDLKIPSLSVIGSGVEFSMNFRGLLYLPISIFMLILARRRNWHGIYQFLFPHSVTLAWLQISIINSQSATAFGLLRSTLGVAGIFFFLPIFGLATLLIPVLAAVEFLSVADSTNRIFITISTSLIAIVCSYLMAVSQRTGKYVTYIQVLICILAAGFLFRPLIQNNSNSLYASYLQHKEIGSDIDTIEDTEVLTFDMFNKYCHAENNRIKSQLRCTHLDNTRIFWNGIVSDVAISSISNWQRDLLQNYLPDFLGNCLMCFLGEMNKVNCFNGEECEMKDFIDNQRRCNVDKWNVYEYKIEIKMSSSSPSGLFARQESKIILKAENSFGNFTTKLFSSDKIWFKGRLKTSLKSADCNKHPFVELNAIGCLHCADKNLLPIEIASFSIDDQLKHLKRGLKHMINILLFPAIIFK